MPLTPALPQDLWARVFTHLNTASLTTCAQVCTAWYADLSSRSPTSSHIWHSLWNRTSATKSNLLPAWARSTTWKHQVSASHHLSQSNLPIINLSRFQNLRIYPEQTSIPDTLGHALAVRSFASHVLIGFENGLGLLRRPHNHTPHFYFDDALQLRPITHISHITPSATVIAATHTALLSVRIQNLRRPIVWRVIDSFAEEQGTVVSLTLSRDGTRVTAGFCNGRLRIVNLTTHTTTVLSMRESADLVADHHLILACSYFAPVSLTVWNLSGPDGRALHRFEQTTPGWEEVTSVSGICPTKWNDIFAIWNGKDAVRLLNAQSGRFVRSIRVDAFFPRGDRSVREEGEVGAACAHIGPGKMVVVGDDEHVVVATSNRVFVVPLSRVKRKAMGQFQGGHCQMEARKAVLALSTDGRVVVTATSDVFGGLGTSVAGRASIGAEPVLQVWDTAGSRGKRRGQGRVRNQISLPGSVLSLSVCADVVAVVCGGGQAVVTFADPTVAMS